MMPTMWIIASTADGQLRTPWMTTVYASRGAAEDGLAEAVENWQHEFYPDLRVVELREVTE